MNLILLLFGPTLMLFIGLQVAGSVPVAFLLFYSWLLFIPLQECLRQKAGRRQAALAAVGLVPKRRNLLFGLGSGVLFLLAIVAAGFFFHASLFERDELLRLLERWQFSGSHAVWLIGILMFVNPLLEELYWRGYLHQKLARKRNPHIVVLVTAFFYSLYHLLSVIPLFAWPYNAAMVLPVFLAGVVWGYMRHRDGSLLGSMLSHILADIGIMMVYLLFLAE